MKGVAAGPANRSGISRRLSVVAVVVILAAAAYFLATNLTSGGGSSSSGTGSLTIRQTSTIGTISTIVEQKGTVGLRSYDWTSFENLTMVIFDNGTIPFVINAVSLGGGAPESVNVTSQAGGCTPTGSSPPFKLPASCDLGEAITIHVAPQASISPCSGPGVSLIITLGGTEQFYSLDVRVGASSMNPKAMPPQNCTTSTPEVGYGGSGQFEPNSRDYENLSPLQGDRYVEINLTYSSGPVQLYLRNSTAIVYTASGQSGTYTYCVPVSGNYELELYNPGPTSIAYTFYVYDLTNSNCAPGG